MTVKSLKTGEVLQGLSEFEERVAVAHGVAEHVVAEEEKQLEFPKVESHKHKIKGE